MKKRLSRGRLAALCALLALTGWTLWGNTALMVTTLTVSSPHLPAGFSGLRIAQVSDLHNAEFGANNEKLLALLAGTAPDLIVITGDLVDSRRTDLEAALDFARGAVQIAPVYYVTGNHEASLPLYGTLKEGLEEAGVVVLEDGAVTLRRDGEELTLIGLSDPAFARGEDPAALLDGKLEGLMGEGYTILLSHRPELFETYADRGVDLVFSGHAHGGQFRLPLIGGLIAPNQGLFPQYDAGLYTQGTTNMVVSRGLGNSIIPIRFNNRPELVVVELHTG